MLKELFSTPSSYTRCGHIDAVKGFAIFLMVLGHVITWMYNPADHVNFRDHVWWSVVYSFLMYVLFFVSGYLFPKKDGLLLKDSFIVIYKRIKSLMIPWLFGGLAYHLLRGQSLTVLWFLIALFSFIVINCVYEVVRKKMKRKHWACDALFYMAVMGIMYSKLIPFNVGNFLHLSGTHYILFSLGIMVKRYGLEKILENKCSFSVSTLLFCVFNYLPLAGFKIPMGVLVTAVSGVVISWYAFKFVFYEGRIFDYFKTLGYYSLEIYIAHGFFIVKVFAIGAFISSLQGFMDDSITRSTIELLVSSVISVIVVTLVLIFVKLTEDSFVFKFFLGKIK